MRISIVSINTSGLKPSASHKQENEMNISSLTLNKITYDYSLSVTPNDHYSGSTTIVVVPHR